MNWQVGQSVKLHPATDWWMRGACTGKIEKVGRKYVHVRLNGWCDVPLKRKAVRFRIDTDLLEVAP